MEDLERIEHRPMCDLRQEQQQRKQQARLDQEPSLGKSITFSQYAYITHIITYWPISVTW